MSINSDWQKYLLNEETERDIFMYIQALQESISFFKPKSMKENLNCSIWTQSDRKFGLFTTLHAGKITDSREQSKIK